MRLRHKTTTAVIGADQWNEDHALALHSLGNLSGSVAPDLANGSVQTGVLVGNITLTLPSVAAGTTEHLTLIIDNDATGGRSITASGVAWVGGSAPSFDTAASARNILVLRGTPGGWIGDGGKVA